MVLILRHRWSLVLNDFTDIATRHSHRLFSVSDENETPHQAHPPTDTMMMKTSSLRRLAALLLLLVATTTTMAQEPRRRLGETLPASEVSYQEAALACSRCAHDDFKNCILDVMVAGDVDRAKEYYG